MTFTGYVFGMKSQELIIWVYSKNSQVNKFAALSVITLQVLVFALQNFDLSLVIQLLFNNQKY